MKLGAKTTVGAGCIIGPGTSIGDKGSVKRSVVGADCKIGSNAKVGHSVRACCPATHSDMTAVIDGLLAAIELVSDAHQQLCSIASTSDKWRARHSCLLDMSLVCRALAILHLRCFWP